MIRTGLDRLLEDAQLLAGRQYGLLAHAASVSRQLRPIHLELLRAGAERPRLLLGPEHGFYGVEQDMVASSDQPDPLTGIPVVSLYGNSEGSLRPDEGLFDDLDLLIIDLQDVGSRYYTYAATAVWSAAVALAAGCEVWVLDRPNPLGGLEVEGNLRRPGFESFVGAFELPVRHGLTLAELVRLQARREGWSGGLRCWEMEGWRRRATWETLGRPWIAPSPNLPTPLAARIYPGACLVEGTELSEGRGTTRPFQLIGAPWLEPVDLVESLEESALAGVAFLPAYFRPQFHKHAGQVCGGVQIEVTDQAAFRPYRCGVELLSAARRVAPDRFLWRREAYEFVTDRPAIDLLAGDDTLRRILDAGEDPAPWVETWSSEEEAFRQERREVLLYPEEAAAR